MISMATPSISAIIAADTKTALDSTASTSPSKLGMLSLQFSTKLEELQFIELLQENDGTYFLQGFKGSTPKKLKLPNNDNILKLNYSIRINDLNKKVLRIEKRKVTLTSNPDPLATNIMINTGEIHFKNAQIVHLTDSASTLIPNNSSYVTHRVMHLLDLNEVGLPIDKLRYLTTDANEANARTQAIARITISKKENKAATTAAAKATSTNAAAASTSTASASAVSTVAIATRRNQTVGATNPPTNTGMVPPPVLFNPVQAAQQLRAALAVSQLNDDLEFACTVDLNKPLSISGNPITITDKDSDDSWCGSCCM